MKTDRFRFELPRELIAVQPCEQRSRSRLLCVPRWGRFSDRKFENIVALLKPDDLVIVNDSRVIRARLTAYKKSGGKVEILVERLLDPHYALVQAQCSKPLRVRQILNVGESQLRIVERREQMFIVNLEGDDGFTALLERFGEVPLPPYMRRGARAADESRYQTVYAKHPGSVAAPTAGLHFDRPLLTRLRQKGVEWMALTLHVGAGTFLPLRSDDLDEHTMHKERLWVSPQLCEAVSACRQRGGRIVAVGTTVVRALETASDAAGELHAYAGETDLFIRPGYRFRVPDVMVTNFHLPETTLFVLVCAFSGRQRMFEAYRHAVELRYRFFSYGDAMWLERNDAVCR